jgi:hypothetical protein
MLNSERQMGTLQPNQQTKSMLIHPDASRCAGATKGKIVPFDRETKSVSVLAGETHSFVEAAVELLLVAAGIAGVIAGIMTG